MITQRLRRLDDRLLPQPSPPWPRWVLLVAIVPCWLVAIVLAASVNAAVVPFFLAGLSLNVAAMIIARQRR